MHGLLRAFFHRFGKRQLVSSARHEYQSDCLTKYHAAVGLVGHEASSRIRQDGFIKAHEARPVEALPRVQYPDCRDKHHLH